MKEGNRKLQEQIDSLKKQLNKNLLKEKLKIIEEERDI